MNNRLEKVKNETLYNGWANKEAAQMIYNAENILFQLVRLTVKDDMFSYEVSPYSRKFTNCPIIAKGIVKIITNGCIRDSN